jgi:hypothetical protein
MAEQSKAALIAQLEHARSDVAHSLGGLTQRLDVQARLRKSVSRNKTLWFSGAAMAGFLLTRLPRGRKETRPGRQKPVHRSSAAEWSALLLVPLLKAGLSVFKPTIAALASKAMADLASRTSRHHTVTDHDF